MVKRSQRASRSGMGAFSMSRRSLCVFVSSPTRLADTGVCLSSRSILNPLPGEGLSRTPIREQAGWVDGQRDRRFVPFPFYPSFSPLSRGETRGQASCFVKEEDASPSRDGRASSPLPGEGGAGWVDGHRHRRLVLTPRMECPLFDRPKRGRKKPPGWTRFG